MGKLSFKKKRIVIIGAGFVGIPVARHLIKTSKNDLSITVIDAQKTFLFTPRLIDVLEKETERNHSFSINLATLAKRDGFRYVRGRVKAINRRTKLISVQKHHATDRLSYDILVLCQGSKINDFGIPGVEKYTLPYKNFQEIQSAHQKINQCVKKALTSPNNLKRELLSVVVVGGGPTGVEAVCALKDYLDELIGRVDPSLKPFASFTLIQAKPQILSGFPSSVVKGAEKELRRLGVNIMLGETVVSISRSSVSTASGQVIPTHLILWAAGVKPNLINIIPPVETDKFGYLATDLFLRLEPNIYAAGDIASVKDKRIMIPKTAQSSLSMARLISTNIQRQIKDKDLIPFHYKEKGTLLIMGNTGFFSLKTFGIKSSLTNLLRKIAYNFRFKQITGGK